MLSMPLAFIPKPRQTSSSSCSSPISQVALYLAISPKDSLRPFCGSNSLHLDIGCDPQGTLHRRLHYGFFASGPQILFAPITHSLYGTGGSCMGFRMGVRMGLVLTFIGAAMLIAPSIQGWLMSLGGHLTVNNPTQFYWAQVFADLPVSCWEDLCWWISGVWI